MEQLIRSSQDEEVLIAEGKACPMSANSCNLFKNREFLMEFFGSKVSHIWGYPYLTQTHLGVFLLAIDQHRWLGSHDWKVNLNFIGDVRFDRKRGVIKLKYNIPKMSKGFFGRGSHTGYLIFQTLKFPTWQSHLSSIVLGRQKENLEEKIALLDPELDENKLKLDELREKILAGDISEEMYNKFAAPYERKIRELERRKIKYTRDIETLRVYAIILIFLLIFLCI